MFEFYRMIAKEKQFAVNNQFRHKIILSVGIRGRKVSSIGSIYSAKAEAIKIIDQLIENAEYNNWGEKKDTDPDFVTVYLNFKVKCKIDSIVHFIRLSIQVRKDGTFYYNHETGFVHKKYSVGVNC
jgi:hypothetical protein